MCRAFYTRDDCRMFCDLVKFTAGYLQKGLRVAIHCRQGHRRTGIAIYLVLRHLGHSDLSCLRTMARMRPLMHREFVKQTDCELHRMAQGIFADHLFWSRFY